ncbi:MAG TPA: hypothetical protein DGL25_06060 [Dehalococcoidia bacterium]|nr:hypothetical protein [Dehalococcoidia bacterium]
MPNLQDFQMASSAKWKRIQSWGRVPLLWILVTPILTLPLSALLLFTLGGEHRAEALDLPAGELCRFEGHIAQTCFFYFEVWRTWLLLALPGLFNLVVIFWLFHSNGYVRVAAGIALTLGLVRSLVVPFAAIGISHFSLITDGGMYFQVELVATGISNDISSPSEERAIRQLLTAAWIGGAVAWAATIVVWQLYEPLMARYWRNLHPPGGPRAEALARWHGFFGQR